MIKVDISQKIPIKMWVDNLEEKALQQARNLANLPFAYKWIVLMPDAHMGYGMPIGGVFAAVDVIIPNAVGVDIGCGMCAVQLPIQSFDIDSGLLKEIAKLIRDRIPVGMKHHKDSQDAIFMPGVGSSILDANVSIIRDQYVSASHQLGTLGSGNHFIEIQKGDDGHIWIMIHSGSRNLGYQVAKHYNKVAKDLNEKWHVSVPSKVNLAFLPVDSNEGQSYLTEMKYCVDFALCNRRLMMNRVIESFKEVYTNNRAIQEMTSEKMINIAHNYTSLEHHYGKNVWIHRKGATLAREGTIGIIPGSQGTKSYIVRGKGNSLSFNSCSHGAGRKMGREDAKKRLDLEHELKFLEDREILHSIKGKEQLDEASGAYKDIEIVMKNQEDLVDIVISLEPLLCIKGINSRKRKRKTNDKRHSKNCC